MPGLPAPHRIVPSVKYAIVIADGAADKPLEELDGKTPLDAAETPNLDRLAAAGKVGRAATTPAGFSAGSDVCSMSLLGYDPALFHTGRAPIEAAALGIDMPHHAWVFRVNLVTVSEDRPAEDGRMIDHSAGGLPRAEAQVLFRDLAEAWRKKCPEHARDLALHHGESYRGIAVETSGLGFGEVDTVPPHEIPGEPWRAHLPDGGAPGAAERLCALTAVSHETLARHEINHARREAGLRPANMAWIWGQGTSPRLPSFEERFDLRGAMLSPVDLLRGLGRLIGWELLDAPGLSSYHAGHDYAAQAAAAVAALDRFDIVCCHVESPDEASHQADWKTKLESIEAIDRDVIGPISERLAGCGDPETDPAARGWRLLVLPDHYTLVSTRKHDPTPVPFLLAGTYVRSVVERRFTEAEADGSDLQIPFGHELMEYFLRGGLAKVMPKR